MHTVRTIRPDEFRRFLDRSDGASYQQTSEWSRVRSGDWEHDIVGWFDTGREPVAAAVIRYRRLPGIDLRFAYIPQGPLLDWSAPDAVDRLSALEAHLRARRVFGLRISPALTLRRWDAETVRAGLADPGTTRFSQLPPDDVSQTSLDLASALRDGGWRELIGDAEADASQPHLNFHLRLEGLTEEAVQAKMTKAWRKNIRRSAREGVEVTPGGRDDLADVHRLFVETAERNGFSPQPRSHIDAIWESMSRDFPGTFVLDIARHEGTAIAANATARIGRRVQGVLAATSAAKPETRASNAAYWTIIRRALADGAELLDLGGVEDTLDEADHASGLIRFKAGMGADAHESLGVWDRPLQPLVYGAFVRLLPLRARLQARPRAGSGPAPRRAGAAPVGQGSAG
ncbi:hypothetical protein B8X04_03050 [Brevibacterium casei]|uniref:Lipid II:glycine glycyltransferase n=1 Tax=Brevibacterium casei TaxID=33889 RepID=A0A269ZIS4_9MICO|nr:peptidoglycan bridge formation glycyltransferase FemA/FemB family protein [Brevibacterium casei]PAK96896.1 hypothetical protein B8X04_03050 [Brevibacterium casei]